MVEFTASLNVWKSDAFARSLKRDMESLPTGALPLEQATTQGGYVDDSDIAVTVITWTDQQDCIEARVGVFFKEIVGGCSCGDEPTAESAYCEMLVSIDKATAETRFGVLRT